MKIYVASSWRNNRYDSVIRMLNDNGYSVFNWKNPTANYHGFHWQEIDPLWRNWNTKEYLHALQSKEAKFGYESDFNGMMQSDACILLLPCGKSAHLEAGYFIGVGKPVIIYLEENVKPEPELMYKMADLITDDFKEICGYLQMVKRHASS